MFFRDRHHGRDLRDLHARDPRARDPRQRVSRVFCARADRVPSARATGVPRAVPVPYPPLHRIPPLQTLRGRISKFSFLLVWETN